MTIAQHLDSLGTPLAALAAVAGFWLCSWCLGRLLVTCSGIARDNQSLLKMMERLSAVPGVTDVHRDQIRGRAPIQFTFDFRWNEGREP